MILHGFLILNITEPYKTSHPPTAHNRPYLLNTTKRLGYTPHLIKYSAFLLHTTTFFTLYHTTYEHLDSCIYALTLHDHTGSLVHSCTSEDCMPMPPTRPIALRPSLPPSPPPPRPPS